MSLSDCKLIDFPTVCDSRGNLIFIEEKKHVPFEIKRVYYLCDVASGSKRGGHSHKEMRQIVIALSGSFNAVLDDGVKRQSVFLNNPHHGIYIPPGIWRELSDFSSNAVALVLASTPYDERDYERDYDAYRKMKQSNSP